MTVKLESASRPGQVVPNDGDVTVVAGTDQRANDTDRRRSSMRKAIDDISSLTESAEKKKSFKGIRFQMKVLFGLDVFFFAMVLLFIIKMLTLSIVLGLGFLCLFGLLPEAVALYIHFLELRGIELTKVQVETAGIVDDVHFDLVTSAIITAANVFCAVLIPVVEKAFET